MKMNIKMQKNWGELNFELSFQEYPNFAQNPFFAPNSISLNKS
jgi:hypothetical protein